MLLRPKQSMAMLKADHVQKVEVKRVEIIDDLECAWGGSGLDAAMRQQAAYQVQVQRQQQAPQPSPLEALFGGPWR
ncbi:hypothetical protein LCGC14_1411970 [marine sediment metagenome]|uniref:Uncharacterized protein n=1 Tax=marine sediment metagenome TaxID=412755 RepID=A0A0F9JU40_9ZZZZ|nr:hypothetical protein [Pricia sp.]